MVYLLARVFYAVHDRTEQTLKPDGLTPMQFTILASVGRWKGLSSAELSRRFKVTPQTMGEMIANLERRGLVARLADPDNRRTLKLELTADGEQLVETCTGRMRQMELELFSAFSPQELHELRERLVALHQHLGLTPQ
jgi:DNA-binding MarR family transcriptional regulator